MFIFLSCGGVLCRIPAKSSPDDGAISCHDMFDFLHLTGGGYAKICKPLHELIMQLLEETPEEKQTTIAWLAPVSVTSIPASSDQFSHWHYRILLFLKALCIVECSYLVFEGEEGSKLVLYIEGLFYTGKKLAKEDGCLNSFETRRGLFSYMCDTVIELSLFFLGQHQA